MIGYQRRFFLFRKAALPVLAIAVFLFFPAFARAETQIVVIGDSNVAGVGVSSSESYPAQLERALRGRGYNVHVINAGKTGDTSAGVLGRLDSSVPQGTKAAIVWVGINDMRSGVSPNVLQANRAAIASHLRARGMKVLLLPPQHGLANQPQYLSGDRQNHLNAAGYAVVVARTLPQVEALIGKH